MASRVEQLRGALSLVTLAAALNGCGSKQELNNLITTAFDNHPISSSISVDPNGNAIMEIHPFGEDPLSKFTNLGQRAAIVGILGSLTMLAVKSRRRQG